MSDSQRIPQPGSVSVYLLYQSALRQIAAGESPPQVIRAMIAAGESPVRVTLALRQVHDTLERRAAARAAHRSEAGRYAAAAIRAGSTDVAVQRGLVDRGMHPEIARLLAQSVRRSIADRPATVQRPPRPATLVWQPLLAVVILCLMLWGVRYVPTSADEADLLSPAPVAVPLDRHDMPYVANAVVIGDQINVRVGPGAEYPVLTRLSADEPLLVVARAEGVARFKAILRDSRVGWLRADPDRVHLLVAPDSIPLATAD